MPKSNIEEVCSTYRVMTVRFTDGREIIVSVRGDLVTDEEVQSGGLGVYEVAFTEAYPLPEGYYFDSWHPKAAMAVPGSETKQ